MEKICLVIPSLQAGGAERVMSELSYYFSKRDHLEVHLVLYGITRELFYSIPDSVIVHKPEFDFENRRRLGSTIKTLIFLRNKIKAIEPDSILSFGEYWNNFVLVALKGLGYPIYVSDRSQPDKSLGRVHDTLRRWLYPKAAGVIVQTQKALEIGRLFYKNSNIVVIGNPIREIMAEKEYTERENIVLSVGRLIHSKHHDELIRLFARINNKNWRLVIVGYDHLKQKNMVRLKALVKDLGMEENITLAGKVDDVESLYLKSKIFAFTSSSEGFPNVIGEAMSSGLPVVSFDCVAGPSEMIYDGENGFLIPLFDYRQFQEKLTWLMEEDALRERMGNNARQSIKRYSPDVIGSRFYEFVVNRKRDENGVLRSRPILQEAGEEAV